MKRVLITGASGFIGGHLSVELARAGKHVTALHCSRDLPAEVSKATKGSLQLNLLDAEQLKREIRQLQPEVILHAAALTSVNLAEEQPELAWSINEQGTKNLLAASEALSEKPLLVYFSTDLVFDGSSKIDPAFSEQDSPQAATNYSRSKLAGEAVVQSYTGPSVLLRTALTYGPPIGQNEGCMGWLLKGLREQSPVKLFVDEWRTPVYVADIASAIGALLAQKPSKDSRLFHLGGAERISRYDFGLSAAEVFGYSSAALVPSKQAEVASNVIRAKDASLCIDQIKAALGIAPVDIRSGLRQMKKVMG